MKHNFTLQQIIDAFGAALVGNWEHVSEPAQVRPGDMLKVSTPDATHIYKHAVKEVVNRDVKLKSGQIIVLDFKFTDIYRIPAPVQHPDPMEHHIITCHDRENDYFWNGVTGKYMSLYDPRNLYSREDFTDWSPAKVVADDE